MGSYTDGYVSNQNCYPQTICDKVVCFENCIECLRNNRRWALTCTKLVGTANFRRIIYSKEWIELSKEKQTT